MRFIKTSSDRDSLKKAMTHESFYESSNVGNSRLVFLGMFVFRGKVGEKLYKWLPVKGQMLQHVLGNHFSKNRLHHFFDKLDLMPYVRSSEGFDVQKHKHIFVYAFWGWLIQKLSDSELDDYITRYFLDQDIIEGSQKHQFNIWQQLIYLVKTKYKKDVKLNHRYTEGKHFVEIFSDDDLLSEHQSKSEEYARKKAIEKAIKYITDQDQSLLHDFMLSKEEKERQHHRVIKEKRHKSFLKRNELKKLKRQERAEELKIERQEKEKKRRKAKQQVKKAKERRKEGKIVITADMNAAKRRRLEDKLK